ncbi:hypothetical protein ACF0H5_002456 [Mactra antiquata]
MGCGASKVEPEQGEVGQRPGVKPQQNGAIKTDIQSEKRISSTDSNANRADSVTNNPVPKSVAFIVDLDGKQTENKLLGPAPPRLKRLDPLNVPKLTAEDLAEKQKIADEKREAQLKRKQSASYKASKRRQQILEAQKFDQELVQKEKEEKIQESLASAGKTRDAKLKALQEKQRIREERAKRAREKVKKMNEIDQELDIEVEKDEDYNAEETDSWLDGDNNNNKNNNDNQSVDSGERIYSGRTSPKKRFTEDTRINRGISAQTIDSFDNAYQRKPPSGSRHRGNQMSEADKDDFFDT